MNGDFPRMLYRRGDEATIFENLKVDTKIVANEAEQAAALAEGWHVDPSALNKLRYQEGGDPPTAEGGQPADHDWDKGLSGQRGRADHFDIEGGAEELAKAKEKAAKEGVTCFAYPPGNPPRSEDRSVPPPAAETEGAEESKKHPGKATERAEKEFAAAAKKAREEGTDKDVEGAVEEKRGPGRPKG